MQDAFTVLTVRVTPGAPADAIGGWREGALLVRVSERPVDGRANAAVERFLAKVLGIAPSQVRVVSGARGRSKRVRIEGLEKTVVLRRLEG
jgi:uncharacterized protein (TIGR00251 family)